MVWDKIPKPDTRNPLPPMRHEGFHDNALADLPVRPSLDRVQRVTHAGSIMVKEVYVSTRLLVIGYGSPLRGDDAAGFIVASELEAAAPADVDCRAIHQLTPDLAAICARADDVVFIDAYPARSGDALRIVPLSADPTASTSTHGCSPASVLALSRQLYGCTPRATLLAIPACGFELGAPPSDTARTAMREAIRYVEKRMAGHA